MKKSIFLLFSFFLLLSACVPKDQQTLTIMTHDSFAISREVVAVFEDEYNASVVFLASGDAG